MIEELYQLKALNNRRRREVKWNAAIGLFLALIGCYLEFMTEFDLLGFMSSSTGLLLFGTVILGSTATTKKHLDRERDLLEMVDRKVDTIALHKKTWQESQS